jgi:hypothetical protein
MFVLLSASRILIEWRNFSPDRYAVMRRAAISASIIALADILVFLSSIDSGYLSAQNFTVGGQNIAIMKAELSLPLSELWGVVNSGIGIAFSVWLIFSFFALFMRYVLPFNIRPRLMPGLSYLGGLFTVIFGIWFWLIATGGGTQIRYGMPFFMMAMIWMIPAIAEALGIMPAVIGFLSNAIMASATINLALLLVFPNPSAAWQLFTGVAITFGFPISIEKSFEHIINEPRSSSFVIYAVCTGLDDAVMSGLAAENQMFYPSLPPIITERPSDWVHPTAVRIAQMEAAKYIMLEPDVVPPGVIPPRNVSNIDDEIHVFTFWLNHLTPADGVATITDVPAVEILQVTDEARFDKSVKAMVANYNWNSTFKGENPSIQFRSDNH